MEGRKEVRREGGREGKRWEEGGGEIMKYVKGTVP